MGRILPADIDEFVSTVDSDLIVRISPGQRRVPKFATSQLVIQYRASQQMMRKIAIATFRGAISSTCCRTDVICDSVVKNFLNPTTSILHLARTAYASPADSHQKRNCPAGLALSPGKFLPMNRYCRIDKSNVN